MRILVLGLGFFGKNRLKEVLACPDSEVAGIVAKHPDLLAAVGDEFRQRILRPTTDAWREEMPHPYGWRRTGRSAG